ncbi:hypothetical protein UFOVP350_7 [uncultured Caudovirales phage]|uniref:Uncharacterized protein n=1 Tax=uncultured Caudovirales phage TaxID=2100421 RepID=A0A6J5M159_9CAUD|nr:hypothetical protein UFOVP350_7 [uncultured Caudovirales phage]
MAEEAHEANHLQSIQMAEVRQNGVNVIAVAVGIGMLLAIFVLVLLYTRERNRTERLQQQLEDIRTLPESLQLELDASRQARAQSEEKVDSLMKLVALADQSLTESQKRMKTNTRKFNENIARIRDLDDYGLLDFITGDLAKVDSIQE